MPRIDFNDLCLPEDSCYYHSEISNFFAAGIVVLLLVVGLLYWIYGIFNSENKIRYIGKSVINLFAVILGPIMVTIFGTIVWFYAFIKGLFGLDKNSNTEDLGCLIWLVWIYRLIFILGVIMLVKSFF